MVLQQNWCVFFLNIFEELNWKNWSNFIAIIFKKKRKDGTFVNLFYIYWIVQGIGLSCIFVVVFHRLMKIPVSFLKPLKEVLTTLTQQPTFKQKNLIFKFKKVQLLCPTPVWSTTRWLPSEETKGSKTHMPLRFDASKASHVSVTLQLPNVTITWTVNAYAWSLKLFQNSF